MSQKSLVVYFSCSGVTKKTAYEIRIRDWSSDVCSSDLEIAMANNRGSQDCPGKITQIIGAVLDIKFPEGALPEINDAIRVPLKNGGELVVEASQHLGCLLYTSRCV